MYTKNTKATINLVNLAVILMLVGTLAIQVANPLQINTIQSMGTMLICFSSLLAFLMSMKKGWKASDLLILLVMILSILLSMFISGNISYRWIVVAMCLMEIPLFMGALDEVSRDSIRKAVYVCFNCLIVFYICLSFTSLSHIYYTNYGPRNVSYLTLGFSNPNETSMHLFSCEIVFAVELFDVRGKFLKCTAIAGSVAAIILICCTQSRTGIIMSVFFWLAVWIFRKRRVNAIVCLVSILVPIAFAVLLLSLSDTSFELQLMGDAFDTGRASIYRRVLSGLNATKFLFGNYNFEFQNLHNAFWSIFGTIGAIGAANYFLFIYRKLRDTQKTIGVYNAGKIALIGMLAIIIYSSTEAAYFVAGSAFSAEVISVYLLAVSTKNSNGQSGAHE